MGQKIGVTLEGAGQTSLFGSWNAQTLEGIATGKFLAVDTHVY